MSPRERDEREHVGHGEEGILAALKEHRDKMSGSPGSVMASDESAKEELAWEKDMISVMGPLDSFPPGRGRGQERGTPTTSSSGETPALPTLWYLRQLVCPAVPILTRLRCWQ